MRSFELIANVSMFLGYISQAVKNNRNDEALQAIADFETWFKAYINVDEDKKEVTIN